MLPPHAVVMEAAQLMEIAFWAKCALAYLSLCLMITENFTNLLANQKVH